tara:strand:+ start:485 stop:4720 length:4236 start_codon:yes stop_codon:yes gene_type:complete
MDISEQLNELKIQPNSKPSVSADVEAGYEKTYADMAAREELEDDEVALELMTGRGPDNLADVYQRARDLLRQSSEARESLETGDGTEYDFERRRQELIDSANVSQSGPPAPPIAALSDDESIVAAATERPVPPPMEGARFNPETGELLDPNFYKKDLDELGETYLPDSYVRNLRDRTVAGVAEGTLGFLPDLAYATVVGVPQYLSVASGLVYNAGARAIDGLLSTLERNVFETTALDMFKPPIIDPLDNNVVNFIYKGYGKSVRDFVRNEAKAANDYFQREYQVPEFQRDFFTELLYKVGMIAAPIVPFISGVSMLIKTPKLVRNAMSTSESITAGLGKASKNYAFESINRTAGTLNTSVGAGAGWQVGDELFKDTQYRDFTVAFAIPGALIGSATQMARMPINLTFGLTLGAIGLLTGRKARGENAGPFMTKMVAFGSGMSLENVLKMSPDDLKLRMAIEGDAAVKYMEDIASGLKSLPPEYQEPLKKSLDMIEEFSKKYSGPDGEKLQFFMYQATGLGIQQAVIKAALEGGSLKLFGKNVPNLGKLTDIEVAQDVLNDQIKIFQNEFAKMLGNKNINIPQNEYDQLLLNLRKQIDHQVSVGDDMIIRLKEISDPKSKFVNVYRINEIRDVADELFFYDKNFGRGSELTAEQIIRNRDKIDVRINSVFVSAFKSASKIVDSAYKSFYKYDSLVDVSRLVDFAADIKFEEIISPLTAKGTKAGRFAKTQANLLSNARSNTLARMDAEDLEEAYSILRNKNETGISFTTNKNALIDFEILENQLKDLTGNARTQKLKEILEDITTDDSATFQLINDIIPPKFMMSDLVAYRSGLYEKLMNKQGTAEGHNISEIIDQVDDVLDQHFKDLDVPDVKKLYEKAKDLYKKRMLPFKSHSGAKAYNSVYKRDADYEDTLEVKHMFALFTKFQNDEVMVKTFNRMFYNKADRDEARELFQITIGRILNNDFPAFARGFVNRMTKEQIASMQKARMITNDQFMGLQKLIDQREGIRKAVSDDVQEQLSSQLNVLVNSVSKVIDETVGRRSDLVDIIDNLKNPDDLIAKMIDESTTIFYPSVRKGRADHAFKALEENLDAINRGEDFRKIVGENVEENISPVTDQVIRFVNESDLPNEKKLQIFETLEKAMIHRIYTDSFVLTPKRDLKQGMSKAEIIAGDGKTFVPATHSGLLNDINIVQMAKSLGKASNSLIKLGDAVDNIRVRTGMSEIPANKKKYRQLRELYEIAKIGIARVTDVPLDEIGSALAMSSLLSRAYSFFRGVVSLKFIAGDLFLRVAHKKKVEYATQILSNPQAINMMHDVMVKGNKASGEHIKYAKSVLASAFGGEILKQIPDTEIGRLLNYYFNPKDESFVDSQRPNSVPDPVEIRMPHTVFNDPDLIGRMKERGELVRREANRPR